jgi:predicted PurR-regulated permease PerM
MLLQEGLGWYWLLSWCSWPRAVFEITLVNADPAPHYIKHIRNLLLGLFLLASALFLEFAQDFVLPVLLGFFIAITFRPAIRFLARYQVPEWLAASGFIVTFAAVGLVFAYSIAGPIAAFAQKAPAYAETFANKLRDIQVSLISLTRFAEKIQAAAAPAGSVSAQEVIIREGPPIAYVGQLTGYSMNMVATIVLTLVIAAFLMASGDLFYAKLVRVLPTLHDKKTALRIVYDVEREVSSYLLIITGINAVLGLAVALGFHALGMPSPYLWGVLAFTLNFIPYVGAVGGITVAAFMAIVSFDSLAYAALAPLSYAVINGIENQFVSPLFLGRRLQLNAVAMLLALTFWTWLWGIVGTIVAVPLLVTIKVFCDHLDSLSGIGEFLSAKYPEDVPAQLDRAADSAPLAHQ